MKVLLIILAVLAFLIILILSVKAEFTIIFDNGWSTRIKVLFFEKDIRLSELLSFLIAPDKAGKEAAEKSKEKKKTDKTKEENKDEKEEEPAAEGQDHRGSGEGDGEAGKETPPAEEKPGDGAQITELPPEAKPDKPTKPAKKNPIQKIIDEDGVVGILLLVSNLLQTVNKAVTTLIKGLHIYSLYVKMIIGGGGAADIAEKYGSVCGWYYPLKGIILNQMKVDQYDDLIMPDFIAPRSEYELQFIGSISVGLLVKVGLKAGKTFLVNYFKNR